MKLKVIKAFNPIKTAKKMENSLSATTENNSVVYDLEFDKHTGLVKAVSNEKIPYTVYVPITNIEYLIPLGKVKPVKKEEKDKTNKPVNKNLENPPTP